MGQAKPSPFNLLLDMEGDIRDSIDLLIGATTIAAYGELHDLEKEQIEGLRSVIHAALDHARETKRLWDVAIEAGRA